MGSGIWQLRAANALPCDDAVFARPGLYVIDSSGGQLWHRRCQKTFVPPEAGALLQGDKL
jgi:hypothetical protein